MDDYIGGRYSSTSAVGGAVLSWLSDRKYLRHSLRRSSRGQAFCKQRRITEPGDARCTDRCLREKRSWISEHCSSSVFQALNRFPAHLQQVDMESNGKSVNRFGEPVNYPTGPVLWRARYQRTAFLLSAAASGTDIVPLQFVGFRNNQMETDVDIQGSTSQQKLCANVAAQIVAFACGKADENKNKTSKAAVRPASSSEIR